MANLDPDTVEGFGDEWSLFDQSVLSDAELREHFDKYFAVFPWNEVGPEAEGFDLGCGSGRWARLVAPRVGKLHCIDASESALIVARRNLSDVHNVDFHYASVESIPLADSSMDFGYSLGVLHHVPDPPGALAAATLKLKENAPFLVYLYYAFDNRPAWFRALWKATDLARRFISRLPVRAKYVITGALATVVYWPLARLSLVFEKLGRSVDKIPLSIYRRRSFYSMRTDAFDRFATRLEHRFTQAEVREMMTRAGLRDIIVSASMPYWCAVGFKSSD
jgi:ubiquinone/menaquinone biosynthesis C-methylase UbiE